MPKTYPFAALVGQEALKTALILNAIDPSIGGVLIRGEKGTAKSTAARGLAELLPRIRVIADDPYNRDPNDAANELNPPAADADIIEIPAPFVDLPIGATEDRVLGSLDYQAALAHGKQVFRPGLLAAANRGILYVDEVNLLPAHLVDVLLDAAAMGVNTVEREGIAVSHPARFMLVGTMNPEEGDLRPQLLDRFGMMVDVTAPREPELRREVVQRRIAFDADPVAFFGAWTPAQNTLRGQIVGAQARLAGVRLDDEMQSLISRICIEFEVEGLRADITLYKASRALAAWEGRAAVTGDDVRRAVEWALPHRRRRQPFEPPGLDRDKLDQIINPPPAPTGDDESEAPPDDADVEESGPNAGAQVFTASKPEQIKRLKVRRNDLSSDTSLGQRNPAAGSKNGHYTRAILASNPDDLALDATLRSAAVNGATPDGGPVIRPENLRQKIRSGATDTLILFVVDASGSMAARQRMEAVKGAALALLTDAYRQRDRVAVIVFRGTHAEVVLSPTRSVELAESQLQRLPTGGRTPLAHALVLAHDVLDRALRENPRQTALLIVLSDGKANVPLPDSSGDDWEQTRQAAARIVQRSIPALMLDTETGFVRLGRGQELAECLGAEYLRLDDLSADSLTLTINRRMS